VAQTFQRAAQPTQTLTQDGPQFLLLFHIITLLKSPNSETIKTSLDTNKEIEKDD
jgi:hypothetical protein